jgi:hypothetical protein
MSRLPLLVAAVSLVAVLGPSIAARAETAGAARPAGAKVPMHPSTLTVRTGKRARPHHRYHDYAHDTFRSRTPIHGTVAGPRM